MGWLYCDRDERLSDKEFFSNELHLDVVASHRDRGERVVYMAVRLENGLIFGMVARYDTCHDRLWYGYKLIDEYMGPTYYNCPSAILDTLSPLGELFPEPSVFRQYAVEWREKCRRNAIIRKKYAHNAYIFVAFYAHYVYK